MLQAQFNYQPPAHAGLDILFVDPYLLLLNKPSGLLSVPGRGVGKEDCMIARLNAEYSDALLVHRLDMSTSGIMLFARNKAVHRQMSMMFADRGVQKMYIAIVDGLVAADEGDINQPIIADWDNRPKQKIDAIGGKASHTHFNVLSRNTLSQTSRVLLRPSTGRSHQLRVHMLHLGHPILGDEFYADESAFHKAPRLCLHASQLCFTHPITHQPMDIHCAPDF